MRKRRSVPIRTNPTFAFVVDGDCEVWYFQMLKRNERSLTISIEPRIPQKKELFEQFRIVKALSIEYTKVFWIIDLDVILEEARKTRKGKKSALQCFIEYKECLRQECPNVVVIVNNPCIEYFLLLHFEATFRCFENCSKAETQLKKHLKDYEKTLKYYTKKDKDIYLRLRPFLKGAIRNAKKSGGFNAEDASGSITEMHLFFEAEEFGEHFSQKIKK